MSTILVIMLFVISVYAVAVAASVNAGESDIAGATLMLVLAMLTTIILIVRINTGWLV